jgi:hypothetical protein
MSKQTAVEWLIDELKLNDIIEKENLIIARQIVEQAKAMEKEQMVDFALSTQEMFKHQIEEKYNETYRGEK